MDMKKILQAMDGVSTKPVEGSNDMKKFLSVVTEGANPHKVTLPVQMAMQHYAEPKVEAPKTIKEVKKSAMSGLLHQYYTEAQAEIKASAVAKKEIISEQARSIAQRILAKENYQDPAEYDEEGKMAKEDLSTAEEAAEELRSILDSNENLPEWVQAKITKAVDYLDTARDYMKSVEESRYGHRDAYQRDYDSSRTGFGRPPREDDEYHVPDPVDNRILYKVVATVTTPEGSEEKKGVSVKTTGGPKHAETVATKHLEGAGLQVTGIVSVHDLGPV